jgi:hypothetical protein
MNAYLITRDHPAVSYGQPVLVDALHPTGIAYGPGDLFPTDPIGRTCAEVVAENAGHLTVSQFRLAVDFCRLVGIDIAMASETKSTTDLRDLFWDKDADGNYLPNH